jgi:glycosyltransferase involved in cell wall biosynthesis
MSSRQSISFLLPVKNGEKFIDRSLRYMEQNLSADDEIVIVNNGSTDNTLNILNNWAKFKSNVNIIDSQKKGLVNALNTGIAAAEKEWIARFDVDDIYPANRISETKKFLKYDISCVFTDYQLGTDSGKVLGIIPSAIGADQTYLSLVSNRRTAHPSACFNRTAAIEVGGYLEEDFPSEDLSLWLRLSHVGKLVSIPKVLLNYRLSPNSVSNINRTKAINMKNTLIKNFKFDNEIFNKCVEQLSLTQVSYMNEMLGSKRYVLHLYDLWMLSTKTNLSNLGVSRKIVQVILTSLQNYPAIGNLAWDKFTRQINRLQ